MSTKESIRVVIRFRPFNERELKEQKKQKLEDVPIKMQQEEDHGTIEIQGKGDGEPFHFTFDNVIPSEATQEKVFQGVGDGKTFTMLGPEDDPSNAVQMGLIPRCISYIFSEIEEASSVVDAKYKVSFLEIYKERLKDLLDPSQTDLKIRLLPNGDTRVAGLTGTYTYVYVYVYIDKSIQLAGRIKFD
ncbi:kinesin family member 3 [Reticulomyxa filosa]|uniref:Kinesin family member 3 n=1 Tax=Reticulomyxa filosa TaxID=46433 RepID=X6N548_RETFI|nr:kinesin family member 3 [Reticulomyxa filosa]|eukprot:ETO21068.1 kinesin family member 3 [Reticulomyxa filosa]